MKSLIWRWARSDVAQLLFEEGKPYSHYSETINLVAMVFPTVRRQLQPAWDLAFS